MDYELRLVPAAQSVNAGSTTSFDIYFTNNTENNLTYISVYIATNRDIIGSDPEENDGVIYSSLISNSYVPNSQCQAASVAGNPSYGKYINFFIMNEEGGPDIIIPNGKIGTVTFDIANDMQSPLNLTFGIYDDEENLVYAASAISGSSDEFVMDSSNASVTNPQPITITTVKLGPIANLRKSYDYVEDAYDTIETKGGTIPTDKNLANLSDAIGSISGGGGVRASEEDDVLFIDYDGSIVCSYSAEDFLQLTALPANPTHEGLISQGWNWNLSDAKQYVTNHGMIEIGQMYATVSGASEFDIELTSKTGKEVSLYFESYTTATIDWGDNTTPESINNQKMTHTYNDYGEYTIKVSGDYEFGWFFFNGGDQLSEISEICKFARIANNITHIGAAVFTNLLMDYITLPSSITSLGVYTFWQSKGLKCLIIPNGITTLNYEFSGQYGSPLKENWKLKYISLPNGITEIGKEFCFETYDLKRLSIPDSVTTVYNDSSYSFFTDNIKLSRISFSNNISTLPSDFFYMNNTSGQENRKDLIKLFKLKDNVLSLSGDDGCWVIYCEELDLGNNGPSNWNYGVGDQTKKIKFGSNTTGIRSIGSHRIKVLDFTNLASIPTLENRAFGDLLPDVKIIVPDSLYSQWIVATNWVSYADNIIPESEV